MFPIRASIGKYYLIAIPTPNVHYVSFISIIITQPASGPQIVKAVLCQPYRKEHRRCPTSLQLGQTSPIQIIYTNLGKINLYLVLWETSSTWMPSITLVAPKLIIFFALTQGE